MSRRVLLAGRFELVAKVAEGTFAELWRARDHAREGASGSASGDPMAGADVAVKVFRLSALGDPTRPWEAVYREVAAGARLAPHPHVLTAWALVPADAPGGLGTPGLVMEFVAGWNLALWLRQAGRPGPDAAAARLVVVGDLLRGLAHAHASGVAHRDLSFGNVLVRVEPSRDGAPARALLADFGCAHLTGEVATGDAAEAEPAARLQPINPPPYHALLPFHAALRRDVYAFGTLAALALAGRHPLTDAWPSMRGAAWTGVPDPHRALPRRPLATLAPWMTADARLAAVADLVDACVVADPARRPASAVEVAAAWDAVMGTPCPPTAHPPFAPP